MSKNKTGLSIEEVASLGSLHAEREGLQDLVGVMATLGEDPIYQYPTLSKQFSGRDKSQQFYEHFFANFSPNVIDYTLINQWVNETSVTQEYDMTLSFDGVEEKHRVLGVLFVVGDKLGGERVYASEKVIRKMTGPLFDGMTELL